MNKLSEGVARTAQPSCVYGCDCPYAIWQNRGQAGVWPGPLPASSLTPTMDTDSSWHGPGTLCPLPIAHLVMMGRAPGWSVLPTDSCLVPCPQRAAAWSESRAGGAEVRKQCPGPASPVAITLHTQPHPVHPCTSTICCHCWDLCCLSSQPSMSPVSPGSVTLTPAAHRRISTHQTSLSRLTTATAQCR